MGDFGNSGEGIDPFAIWIVPCHTFEYCCNNVIMHTSNQ